MELKKKTNIFNLIRNNNKPIINQTTNKKDLLPINNTNTKNNNILPSNKINKIDNNNINKSQQLLNQNNSFFKESNINKESEDLKYEKEKENFENKIRRNKKSYFNIELPENIRYKYYLQMIKDDARVWPIENHILYLLSNNIMALVFIKLYFYNVYYKISRNSLNFYNFAASKNRLNLRILTSNLLGLACIGSLIYYTRFYLYDNVYKEYYSKDKVSDSDFQELYEKILLNRKIKE